MAANSTVVRSLRKVGDRPAIPYPDFPLDAHQSGGWARKSNGRMYSSAARAGQSRGSSDAPQTTAIKPPRLYSTSKNDLDAGPRARANEQPTIVLA